MKFSFNLILLFLTSAISNGQTITIQGSPFEFDTRQINSIPVTLKYDNSIPLFFEAPVPFSVRNGNVSSENYRKGVTYTWDPKTSLLKVTVDPKLLDAQGTYDVNLRYRVGSSTNTYYLNFSLIRPAAVLSIDKINIIKQGCSQKKDNLVITETSGKAGVGSLSISSCYVPGIEKPLINLPAEPIKILAGGQESVAYTLNEQLFDQLPLGETIGKLQLMANSITAPIPVQISISKKLSKWWIVVTVFAGLLVGTFVRNTLKAKKEIGQARLNGLQLIRDIKSRTLKIEDPAFQDDMNSIVQDVLKAIEFTNRAVKLNGPSVINTAIELARSQYSTKKNAFGIVLSTSKANYIELKAELFDESLTPQISAIMSEAQESVKKAGEKLSVFNPTEATTLMNQAENQKKDALTTYSSYIQGLITFFLTPTNYLPKLPSNTNIATTLQSLANAIQNDHNKNLAAIIDVKSSLQSANRIQRDLDALLDELKRGVLRLYNSNTLASNHPNFTGAFDKWYSALSDMVNNPEKKIATKLVLG